MFDVEKIVERVRLRDRTLTSAELTACRVAYPNEVKDYFAYLGELSLIKEAPAQNMNAKPPINPLNKYR